MICQQCEGTLQHNGFIKLSEITYGDNAIVTIFCTYACMRHYFGWRRQ